MVEHAGYDSGHPWYYKLGGRILTPDEVKALARATDSKRGDNARVAKLAQMSEPRRSKEVRAAIAQLEKAVQGHIYRYLQVSRRVQYERERPGPYTWDERRMWNEPDTATSLTHNHITYDQGTIEMLKRVGWVQLELF